MNGTTDAGSVLGSRYRLLSVLGVGGTAAVWQAHDAVLDRTVAIKVVAGGPGTDAGARDLLQREARAAAALSHPNIAQVHDYGETVVDRGVVPYVVMELVPGGTLAQRLAAGPVTARFAMRVGAEIAAGLAAAHAEGVVHQDVKPANVMLPPTGAKVVDFGIAAAIAPGGTGALAEEVFGTPAYLAPERLMNDAVEPASDVYALGVLLYGMLSGQSPWTVENTTQMLTAHLYIDPVPLPPLPGVPAEITDLCNRCLAKDPADRPSAPVVAALLAEHAGLRVVADEPDPAPDGAPAGAEPPVVVRPPQEPTRPGRRWLAAAFLLVLAGTGGWLATREDPPAPEAERPAAAGSSGPAPALPPPPAGPRSPGSGAVATAGPAVPPVGATTAGAAPVTTAPAPGGVTATATTPEPTTTTAPEPEEQTFTSPAGTLTATCPSADTAQIASWRATPPYRVESVESGPAPAPSVAFKRGKSVTTMTVTCTAHSPSATVTES